MSNAEEIRQSAVLTIAGSDSGGNAGIQADLRAFHYFGVHGCTAITALTAQNQYGVKSVVIADGPFMVDQLECILNVYAVQALKTGMLATAEVIEAVAGQLALHARIAKVIDPVMVATSGAKLLDDDAIEVLKQQLLPLATLITPNLPEVEVLLGRTVMTREAQVEAARELAHQYGCAVLIKGGHGSGMVSEDVFADESMCVRLSLPRIEHPLSTHGTGCSLSAAIAASLACGRSLLDAVKEGKAFVYEAIRAAVSVGDAAQVLGTPLQLPLDQIVVDVIR